VTEDPYADDDRSSYGDVPPHDTDAERAVLGAMLLSKTHIEDVVPVVFAPDFYQPAHEVIYGAIIDLYTRGAAVDVITVSAELERLGELRRVGGPVYIAGLTSTDAVPMPSHAPDYAERVRDKAVLRRLADAGSKIRAMAMAGQDDATALLDAAEAAVLDAVPNRKTEDYHLVADVLDETVDAVEAAGLGDVTTFVPTGFLDLDDLLRGFGPGQMITVAARPGLGKSTLALDFCRAASLRAHMTSVFFSLEMTRQEVTMRLLSAEAKVALANLRSGQLGDAEWSRIAAVMGKVSAAPLYVDDTASITMTEIRAKARRLKVRHDLRLIVIDYLQLMTSGKKVESRQTEVSEFSRQVKLLAKELEVPVVALSQLNRGPEQRTSKRPLMSDLRESGSIEQDSDIVLLLHRDDAYETESSRPGEADLIVAKHRNGATRDIAVAAQLHYSRFTNLGRPV
jgi:replicative DNA helicase